MTSFTKKLKINKEKNKKKKQGNDNRSSFWSHIFVSHKINIKNNKEHFNFS